MCERLVDLPERVETERLYLRGYRAGDEAWYWTMCRRNRAHLTRYEGGNPAMDVQNEADAEIVLREFAGVWSAGQAFFWGAFRRDTDEFVAQIYLGLVDEELPECALGYFCDVDHEGQGYVTEAARAILGVAFEHLGAHRVSIECDDTNERSRRVAERCGMVREGHFRENKRHPDGTMTGTLYYGLLRNEFLEGGAT